MNTIKNLQDRASLQQLQLFTKLTKLKQQNMPIEGVAVISSDCQDNDGEHDIPLIKRKLDQFKEQKAREVAKQHIATKESIESIIAKMKDHLQYEALCIIKPHIANSVENSVKGVKDMGSTLPNSTNSKGYIETPGFELGNEKEITIDLREFTLGQKQVSSGKRGKQQRQEQWQVSDFHAGYREPSSKRIKDRIINSNKRNFI